MQVKFRESEKSPAKCHAKAIAESVVVWSDLEKDAQLWTMLELILGNRKRRSCAEYAEGEDVLVPQKTGDMLGSVVRLRYQAPCGG